MTDAAGWTTRFRAGDMGALARAISWVENSDRRAGEILRELFPTTGRAITIGVTGFPGAGKSSLCDRLISVYRAQGKTVGVIAVDPSSAFSGGAILGDRIRMMRHAGDTGVYIRSMATRGHLGGLSRSTADALDLLDAFGKDVVIVETVGVGQDEVEVAKLTDTVLVVLVPGMGDDIQAIKAGILEIADLFVVNKADREGSDKLVAELTQMMTLTDDHRPRPPILKTVATQGQGIDALIAAIQVHRESPDYQAGRVERRQDRARGRLTEMLTRALLERTLSAGIGQEGWERLIARVAGREIDPYTAVEQVLAAERKSTP